MYNDVCNYDILLRPMVTILYLCHYEVIPFTTCMNNSAFLHCCRHVSTGSTPNISFWFMPKCLLDTLV